MCTLPSVQRNPKQEVMLWNGEVVNSTARQWYLAGQHRSGIAVKHATMQDGALT